MRSTIHPPSALALLLLLGFFGAPASGADLEQARQIVLQTKAHAGDIPAQLKALTRLAWPEQGAEPADPAVASLARAELVDSGKHGFRPLYEALAWVDKVYSADIVAALIEAREGLMADIPLPYIPAMDRAIWTGSVEAKRLSMEVLAMHRFRPDMLAIQDAAIEHPELMPNAIINLVRLGDDRARFFLGDLLEAQDGQYRTQAAQALAELGGRCHDVLRDAVISERAEIRRSAIQALVPISGIGDLSVLYEYLAKSEDEDPELAAAIRERAKWLESLMEQQQDRDAG